MLEMKESCRHDALWKTIVCCVLAVPFLFGGSATGDKDAEHKETETTETETTETEEA